jgi:hypothetical protein
MPSCLAAAAAIAGSATETGGLGAFVLQKLLRIKSTGGKECKDGYRDNNSPERESGLADRMA